MRCVMLRKAYLPCPAANLSPSRSVYPSEVRACTFGGSCSSFWLRSSALSSREPGVRGRGAARGPRAAGLRRRHPGSAPRDRAVPATPVGGASATRLDGELNDAAWSNAPVIDGFVQREPSEGKPPSFKTEARVVYDRSALYVSVRAFDPDPSKIVGILTRRDTDSPSDWVSIIVDSYHDRRTAYEFAVNAAGVKIDRYRFADRNEDVSWDAVWDVKVVTDAEGWRAQFRIPFSQLRFDPQELRARSASPSRGGSGGSTRVSTWPLLPRGASGYVSSLGELTGLQLQGGRKRLEVVPYTVGQLQTQEAQVGNPFVTAPRRGVRVRRRHEVRRHPGSHADGHDQPRLRPGRGRPRRRQPLRLRDLLRRAAAVLRRGIRHLPIRHRLQRRRVPGPLLLPAHRPDAPRHAARHRWRLPLGAFADDDSRGGEAHRPRRLVLGGRAERGDARGARLRVERPRAHVLGRRADDELHGGPRHARVRKPVVARLHGHRHQPPPHRGRAVPPRAGLHRRRRLGLARRQEGHSVTGYWAGSTVRGDREAIGLLQTSNVHSYQRPDAGARRPRPVAHVVERHVGAGGRGQDRRRPRALQQRVLVQDAGLRHQRPRASCSAPTRRESATGCSSAAARRGRACGSST